MMDFNKIVDILDEHTGRYLVSYWTTDDEPDADEDGLVHEWRFNDPVDAAEFISELLNQVDETFISSIHVRCPDGANVVIPLS